MNIIVFGGSGFLGSYVVNALCEEGQKVKYDKKESPFLFAPEISKRIACKNNLDLG